MTTNPATWMSDNKALHDIPFSRITLFGSHDSGMSTLQSCGGAVLGTGDITQAQRLSVFDQIVKAGVRYLDIRPVHWSGLTSGGYFAAHYSEVGIEYVGWLGESLPQIVDEIGRAVQQIGPQDVLLIELSHGAELIDKLAARGVVTATWSDLSADQLGDIANAFAENETLKPYLYKADPTTTSAPNFWDLTPNDVVAHGQQVFLFTGADTALSTPTGPVFPKGNPSISYYNTWYDARTADPTNLGQELTASVKSNLAAAEPLLLAYHCTGGPGTSSLASMASQVNPAFMDWLADWFSNGYLSSQPDYRVPNIVTADYVSDTDLRLLEACIGMNYGQYYGVVEQVVSDQSCQQGPALAALGDSTYVAWTGTDSHLNIQSPPGSQTKATSSQGSAQSPALCRCDDAIAIAWTGTDEHLNVAWVNLSTNAIVDVTHSAQKALHAPALAWLNSTLYLAWTGTDNHLNIMWSNPHGDGFPDANKLAITTQKGADSPALCVLGSTVHLVWKGTDNQLNVTPLVLAGAEVTGTGAIHQPGQASEHGPAAAVSNDTMAIAYVGTGYNKLSVVLSTDGQTFTSPYVSTNASNATPAMCVDATGVGLAWAGTDNNHSLNTAHFVLPGQTT